MDEKHGQNDWLGLSEGFFEEYARHNVTYWGVTIENEPGAGSLPFWTWQAMYLSATTQREFAVKLLSPILKQSPASKNVKIMAHDDQRSNVFESAEKFYGTPEGVEAIDGIAVHWYAHSNFDKLEKTHNLRPDKFILASEACTGYNPFEHKPLLGDWTRGRAYAHDILNDLRNWVAWTWKAAQIWCAILWTPRLL
uniref:Glucosylceramidase n=1 Tax=Globodera pallida TaxID=36090 RepID=A0A183BU38_GLOPA